MRAVDLLRHDDLILGAAAVIEVFEFDAAAQSDGVARDRIEVDHREFGDSRFQARDPRAYKFLPSLRHRPLRILGEVPMGTCPLQFLGQVDGQLALQRLKVLPPPSNYW